MAAAKPRLVYFSSRGRAELIRVMLYDAGFDFEDVRVGWYKPGDQPEGFLKVKDEGILDFDALPLWQEGDLNLVQSSAILRYLSRKLGRYGSNDIEASLIDSFYGGIEDFLVTLMGWYRASAEDKPKLREAFINTDAPKWFALYERWLKRRSNSDFLVGDKVSFVDFALWGLLDLFRNVDAELQFQEKYPLLSAFRNRFDARPNLKAYVESDRRPPVQIVI
eukprot:TRINITY_DN6113_c0_g1_i1.p1 TRINITY_DN6113_c0_g1~~TRINITY_DN6113_c0_g1_i1.p1  ORF type:complete len:221 (+),score=44.86 TRINITY_DN6113_c0_g1_i1:115-777(+)